MQGDFQTEKSSAQHEAVARLNTLCDNGWRCLGSSFLNSQEDCRTPRNETVEGRSAQAATLTYPHVPWLRARRRARPRQSPGTPGVELLCSTQPCPPEPG